MTDPNALETLLAKQAIQETLFRYARGLDRMDRAMAEDVWHADGTADYVGMFQGTGAGFVEWVWQAHAHMERHSHQIANVLVDVAEDGLHATSESYVTVTLWTLPDAEGRQLELVGRGRYLDRWEKRADRWAIAHRIHVLDLSSQQPLGRAEVSDASRRDETDPSFDFVPTGARR